jgi:hypothetical protein
MKNMKTGNLTFSDGCFKADGIHVTKTLKECKAKLKPNLLKAWFKNYHEGLENAAH